MKERDVRHLLCRVIAGEKTIDDAIVSMRDEGLEIEAERVVLPPLEGFEFESNPENNGICGVDQRLTEEQAAAGAARLNGWERARSLLDTLFNHGGMTTPQVREELKAIFELEKP